MILMDTPNLNTIFGYVSEPEAVLFFGIFLVAVTILIRWVLNKYEVAEKEKGKG